ANELDTPCEELQLRARTPRPVERHPVRSDLAVAVVVVETLAAPAVVRLPRVDRRDDEDLRALARWISDDEEDVARRSAPGKRQSRLVVPARPVGADADRVGDGPLRAHDAARGIGSGERLRRTRLGRQAVRGNAGDE